MTFLKIFFEDQNFFNQKKSSKIKVANCVKFYEFLIILRNQALLTNSIKEAVYFFIYK